MNYTKAKKKEGNRLLDLSSRAIEILQEQEKLTKGSDFVFLYNNAPLTTNRYNTVLKRLCKKASVQYHSSHKIRFWSVTAMDEAGVPLPEIQKAAGHLDRSTTEHYVRSKKETKIDAATWNGIYN